MQQSNRRSPEERGVPNADQPQKHRQILRATATISRLRRHLHMHRYSFVISSYPQPINNQLNWQHRIGWQDVCALVKSWVLKWVSIALAPAKNCCTTGKPNFRARGTTPTALHTLHIHIDIDIAEERSFQAVNRVHSRKRTS